MPKVSVLVPVYGVEKYIERCARSLFEQTLDDMEFIFVDDCTPDRSMQVLMGLLNEYPRRKSQVKIIRHETNQGLPAARQSGLKIATGEYIAHCDSDDWVDIDLYECLYRKAVSENLDVTIFHCKTIDGDRIVSETAGGYRINKIDCINDMMRGKMWWSLCNKMIKKTVYSNQICYPKDGMGEDMCLTLQLFYYCERIGYVDKYYYYFINSNSIIQHLTEEKCLSKFYQITRNVEIVKGFYRSNKSFVKGLHYLEYNTKFTLLPALGKKEIYSLWKQTYKGCELKVATDTKVRIKDRVKAFLSAIGLYPFPRDKYGYLLNN